MRHIHVTADELLPGDILADGPEVAGTPVPTFNDEGTPVYDVPVRIGRRRPYDRRILATKRVRAIRGWLPALDPLREPQGR